MLFRSVVVVAAVVRVVVGVGGVVAVVGASS